MSHNERQAASRFAQDYEIHYWGTIRLEEKPEFGYDRLIGVGYPIVILNPHRALGAHPWTIRPQMWRVRREDGQ